jgi:DNA-binding NarL/FixJ family response regulator
VKIVVIEDHALIRDLLVKSCRESPDATVVLGARDGVSGLELCREHQPDLLVLDLALPDGDGIDLLKSLRAVSPGSRVIALTSHTDEFTLHRALSAHVHGFVDKNEQPLDILAEAIREVMAGRTFLSSVALRTKATLRSDPAAFNKLLSEHEQYVLGLFGLSLSNEEVGEVIEVTPGTAKNHRQIIMGKLGIHSTPHLIRYAAEKGFTRVAQQRLSARSTPAKR